MKRVCFLLVSSPGVFFMRDSRQGPFSFSSYWRKSIKETPCSYDQGSSRVLNNPSRDWQEEATAPGGSLLMTLQNTHCWITAKDSVRDLYFYYSTLGCCGGLTLPWCQVPTKAALSLPLLSWTRERNIMKGSWVEIRTGRSLTNYCHWQNKLDLGKMNLNYY